MAAEDEIDHCDCADHLERYERVKAAAGGWFPFNSAWDVLFGPGEQPPTEQNKRYEDACDVKCIPKKEGPYRCMQGGYRAVAGGHFRGPVGRDAYKDRHGADPNGQDAGRSGYNQSGAGGQDIHGRGGRDTAQGSYVRGQDGYGRDANKRGYDAGAGQLGYNRGQDGYDPATDQGGGHGRDRGQDVYGPDDYSSATHGQSRGHDGPGAKRRSVSDVLIPIIGSGLIFLTLMASLYRRYETVLKTKAEEGLQQIMDLLCDVVADPTAITRGGSGSGRGSSGGSGGGGGSGGIGSRSGGIFSGGGGIFSGSGSGSCSSASGGDRSPRWRGKKIVGGEPCKEHEEKECTDGFRLVTQIRKSKGKKRDPCQSLDSHISNERRKFIYPPDIAESMAWNKMPKIPGLDDCPEGTDDGEFKDHREPPHYEDDDHAAK